MIVPCPRTCKTLQTYVARGMNLLPQFEEYRQEQPQELQLQKDDLHGGQLPLEPGFSSIHLQLSRPGTLG